MITAEAKTPVSSAGQAPRSAPGPHATEELRRRVMALAECGLSLPQLALDNDMKRAELMAWLHGRSEEVQLGDRIAAWLNEREREEVESEPTWVDTPTAKIIWAALARAQSEPTIAVIYGGAGVGKTTTLRRYVENFHRFDGVRSRRGKVVMVTATKFIQTPAAILAEIAEALGAHSRSYRNEQLYKEAVIRMTCDLDDGENALLIVDEAQHLRAEALDGIRAFHDTGCIGIAYAGNDLIYTQMRGKSPAFAQLSSRVGAWRRVAAPKAEDVYAMLDTWRISGRRERELALTVANRPGCFRDLVRLLREARKLARNMGLTAADVDNKIMVAAAGFIGMEV